ncbi:hypothetical protein ACFWJW_06325 [Streptomyces sp. NPDC127097]|uniref:hypothetical protein n=1 Tax=Streptomyces sp. NPDC127097 TaxID=3347136 RepID=UPI00364A47B0
MDTGRRAPVAAPPHLAPLRRAISLFFALDGFVFAGWVVRIPAIKEQIHASAGALGPALDAAPVPHHDGTGTPPTRGRAKAGRTRLLITAYGLITLCTAYGEGALADWGALHLSADLHTGPGAAAAGYAVFALLMTNSRMAGTRLLERLPHWQPSRHCSAGWSGTRGGGRRADRAAPALPLPSARYGVRRSGCPDPAAAHLACHGGCPAGSTGPRSAHRTGGLTFR